jgi:hypothetical protein
MIVTVPASMREAVIGFGLNENGMTTPLHLNVNIRLGSISFDGMSWTLFNEVAAVLD